MMKPKAIAATALAWGARIALWPARVTAARAAFRQLAAMDARELADIGLTEKICATRQRWPSTSIRR